MYVELNMSSLRKFERIVEVRHTKETRLLLNQLELWVFNCH